MKTRIRMSAEFWIDDERAADASAGLRAVADADALSSFALAINEDGEQCAVDYKGAYRCPVGELVNGVWVVTGGEYKNARLYYGAALGLSALAGAMTGTGFYRFLPLDWNSVGLEEYALGGKGFERVAIDGLKGCDDSLKRDYVRSDGELLIPADAYAAIWRCVDFHVDDSIARENFAKRAANDAIAALDEYWKRHRPADEAPAGLEAAI